MRHFLFALMLVSAMAACTPTPAAIQPPADQPVSSNDVPVAPPEEATALPDTDNPAPMKNEFTPKASDSKLTRGNIYLSEAGLLVIESYPVQIALQLSGTTPTPCHELRVDARPPDAENRIDVTAYTVTDPNTMCVQVLKEFSVNVPLGSFPTGHYTVWVNGQQVGEFDS